MIDSKINESTLNNHLLIQDSPFLQAPMETSQLRRNKLSKIRCRLQSGRDGNQEISVGRPRPSPDQQQPHPVAGGQKRRNDNLHPHSHYENNKIPLLPAPPSTQRCNEVSSSGLNGKLW